MTRGKKSHRRADRLRRAGPGRRADRQAAGRGARAGRSKTVTPVLEVRSRRVGGANYQVPVEVPQRRARTLAVRWLVTFARDRREKHMSDKLAGEILDALNQQGGAFKRKDDLYRMAQANKAFRALPVVSGWRRLDKTTGSSRSTASGTSGSWPTSTRARRRRPSGSSTTRAAPTRWARCTRAPRRWTGWRRSRSAGSRSRRLRRRRSGATFVSTSSIRPGTWTLRSRSSAACASSTARSPSSTPSPASSRSPRRSGARPTSYSVPRIAFINKMDRTGADFFASVQSMVDRLGARAGAGAAADRPGGALPRRHRPRRDAARSSGRTTSARRSTSRRSRPSSLEQAQEYHHQLIDAVADHDDELLETYLEDEDAVTPEMLKRALRAATLDIDGHAGARSAPPSRTRASSRCSTRSSTTCRARSTCRRCTASTRGPSTSSRARPAVDEPFSALAFKVMSDPYVGKLTYFRVYSGQLKRRRPRPEHDDRQDRAHRPHPPDAREPPRGARGRSCAGEIAAAVGPQGRRPRATRSPSTRAPIRLESMTFPDPVISVAIEPKTKGDQDKLGARPAAPRRGGSDLPRRAPTTRRARR